MTKRRKNKSKKVSMFLEVVFVFEIFSLIYFCPFTKVEESFNMQAMHDLLFHGLQRVDEYDHLNFPGVVPRSFLGAVVVSAFSSPGHLLLRHLNAPRYFSQYLVRGVLGLLGWVGMRRFGQAVEVRFGPKARAGMLAVTCCQFHLPFYLSRSLPNTFALIVLLHAFAAWLELRGYKCVMLGVLAAVVFRCDVIILAVPVGASLLFHERVVLGKLLVVGAISSLVCLTATVLYDSYFWRRWLWPEGIVLFFNTVENKSSEWGVSHPLWYFYSALPRALLATALLIPVGLFRPPVLSKGKSWKHVLVSPFTYLDPMVTSFVLPALVFIYLYSFLPHKELRFIFPSLPIFNMAAGIGISKLFSSDFGFKGWKKTLTWMFVAGCLLVSVLAGLVLATASYHNYPGGVALQRLHELVQADKKWPGDKLKRVHIGVAPAMTGITRFWEQDQTWSYSKQEENVNFESFDFVLTGSADDVIQKGEGGSSFEVIEAIEGFKTLDISHFRIKKEPKIFVLQRKSA